MLSSSSWSMVSSGLRFWPRSCLVLVEDGFWSPSEWRYLSRLDLKASMFVASVDSDSLGSFDAKSSLSFSSVSADAFFIVVSDPKVPRYVKLSSGRADRRETAMVRYFCLRHQELVHDLCFAALISIAFAFAFKEQLPMHIRR